jgi:general secretion pathway protein G
MSKRPGQGGFTLVEVIMVIVILGVLAAVAMKTLDSGLETSRIEETRQEMDQLAKAICGNPELFSGGMRTDFGYVGDVGALPANLDALVSNPGYGTWRGPYAKSDYSNFSEDYKRDAWGQAYVYSGSTTITSVGGAPDTLKRILASSTSELTSNTVAGQISDAAGNPPGDSAAHVRIILSYPNGTGGTNDSIVIPNRSGSFTFPSCVPIGNRRLRAVYLTTHDTVQSTVSVLPKSTAQTTLRFPGALWAATSGSGTSSLQLVPSSVVISGGGRNNIQFSVENPTTSSKFITSIKVTYTPVAYYRQVVWATTTVFNRTTPRAGSDQIVTFSAGMPIGGYGAAVRIQINDFRATPTGTGATVSMSGTPITVLLSDGSSITFTTP